MYDFSVSELIVSLLLTWGIGLTPPLLFRYLIVRRPMSKRWAITVCGLFVVANLAIFIALGSESKTHTAVFLIALVSYWVLRREPQRGNLSKGTKVVVSILIMAAFGVAVTGLVYVTNISSSMDEPTAKFLAALEQQKYKAAETEIRQGADVNYTIAGRTLLHQSVTDNELFNVNFLIKHGANVNTKTKFGRSPPHEAALYGHYEIAKALIEAGSDVNAQNPRGETPLYYAETGLIAGPPRTSMNDKVASLLRSHGAKR